MRECVYYVCLCVTVCVHVCVWIICVCNYNWEWYLIVCLCVVDAFDYVKRCVISMQGSVHACVSMYICVCINVCMCILVYVCVWVLISLPLCVRLRVTAITDSFVRSELSYGRYGFVLVVNPIHRRFEDRSMGWSGDPYRFVQWRPDSDSDLKSC